ncbi:hypothetical protein D9M71_647180 [compost metagenome]
MDDAGVVLEHFVVGRRDVEFTVDAQVFGKHRLDGGEQLATAAEVVDTHRGLVGDHLFLDNTIDSAIVSKANEGPLRVVRLHAHDQTVSILLLHGVEVVVDVDINVLVAVGDHHRIIRIDQLFGRVNRAGSPFSETVQLDDGTPRRPRL